MFKGDVSQSFCKDLTLLYEPELLKYVNGISLQGLLQKIEIG
jgi:hypothetical protein